jgi:hypothetical protein
LASIKIGEKLNEKSVFINNESNSTGENSETQVLSNFLVQTNSFTSSSGSNSSMSSPKEFSTEKFSTNTLTSFKAVNFNKDLVENKPSNLNKSNSNQIQMKNMIMPKK